MIRLLGVHLILIVGHLIGQLHLRSNYSERNWYL